MSRLLLLHYRLVHCRLVLPLGHVPIAAAHAAAHAAHAVAARHLMLVLMLELGLAEERGRRRRRELLLARDVGGVEESRRLPRRRTEVLAALGRSRQHKRAKIKNK